MKIPAAAARALSHHIRSAVNRLDPRRFHQEPAYVAALLARLDAVVYHDRSFSLELRSTVVDDRGRNSAESIWGADFGIVASIADEFESTEKGVIGQAKRASLISLDAHDAETFREQVLKMNRATRATIGLEVPTSPGTMPTVRIVEVPEMLGKVPIQFSPRRYDASIEAENPFDPPVLIGPPVSIGRYLHAELLRCLHGDRNENFVRALEDSSLTTLRVQAHAIGRRRYR